MTSKLTARIDQLESQLVQRDIDAINQADAKLRASLDAYPHLKLIFAKMGHIQNLLELSIVDATPDSVDQLAQAIRPMVEKIAPDIEKLDRNKGNADVGMLEELTNNKDRIGQLCSLQKINLERAEGLGKNTAILLAHYNAMIDNLSRDFAELEAQIHEFEDTRQQ